MTSLVDVVPEVGNLAQIERDLGEAVHSRATGQEGGSSQQGDSTSNVQEDESVLPEKLRGKSKREIAEMYQNLESMNGRMANDLGQQRSLTDRLLDLKRTDDLGRNSAPQNQPKKVDISSAELLDKPTEALERFATSRESALEAKLNDRLSRLEQATVAQTFAVKHPDVQTVAKSTEFVDWVRQSPTRQRAANAAAAGDYGAADDLMTEFKGRQAPTKKGNEEVQDENIRAARSASLESGASNSPETGTKKSGKIYSRADLMRLKLENPDKYYDDAYNAEIQLAYAENRVR